MFPSTYNNPRVIKNFKPTLIGSLEVFFGVKEIITEILKQVIQDGKGIEVNTSSHRYGLKDLTPSRAILRLYKDLNGKIVTIG